MVAEGLVDGVAALGERADVFSDLDQGVVDLTGTDVYPAEMFVGSDQYPPTFQAIASNEP